MGLDLGDLPSIVMSVYVIQQLDGVSRYFNALTLKH